MFGLVTSIFPTGFDHKSFGFRGGYLVFPDTRGKIHWKIQKPKEFRKGLQSGTLNKRML